MNMSNSAATSHARRPSRSNSTSSNNTAKKSTKHATRNSYVRGRSASPDSITRVLHSLNSPKPDSTRTDNQDKKSGSYNVNRWSHSTTSSISAIDTDLIRKRTSSSGATRRSLAGINVGTNQSAVQDQLAKGRNSPRSPAKRVSSTVVPSVDNSRLNFQDSSNLNIVRDQSQNRAFKSPDITTSSWEHRAGVNKFGEPVSGLSIQYSTDSSDFRQPSPNRTSLPTTRSPTNRPGHRDRSANRSKDTSKTSVLSNKSDQSRKGHRSPQQKDMLSKALAKANTAVLLDNASDIVGAIEAYNEACLLLERVMVRSTDQEDQRKLSAIKATYSDRIAELHEIEQPLTELLEKALPEDPPTEDCDGADEYYRDDSSFRSRASKDALPNIQLPMRQESLLPQIFGGENFLQDSSLPPVRDPIRHSQLHVPMEARYMPSPLTPRHQSPLLTQDETLNQEATTLPLLKPIDSGSSEVATSWLDNFDAASSDSSSRLSYNAFNQHHGQLVADIEAEFDAAMNAAVESAYEEQPSQEPTPRTLRQSSAYDTQSSTQHHSKQSTENADQQQEQHYQITDDPLEHDGEEEERLLDEMTREFGLDGSQTRHQTKPSIPRQSDSSGFSARTWGSSVASTTATSGTALSTLAEAHEPAAVPPAPTQSPPKIPAHHSRSASQISNPPNSMDKHIPIRDRRMSGQSAKQLKIETFNRRGSLSQKPLPVPTPSIEEPIQETVVQPPVTPSVVGTPFTPLASVYSGESTFGESPATPALTQGGSIDDAANAPPSPTKLARMMPPPPPPGMRKNISSSSLRKQSLSINTSSGDMIDSPGTPGSAMFPSDVRRRPSTSTPAVPTPGANVLTSGVAGGMYLFDDYVGNSGNAQTINGMMNEPTPLEPCPESFLLRPFWLMRSLYFALSHPQGGFVTQKLFLPRDIWRVRNVKIKALEDKISTCDLLTAALQKLSKVDTFDAGAVLDEMQLFESILEQARSTLSKRLGSEVGLAGTASAFKSSPAVEDPESATPKSANSSSSAAKSLASWGRKLRSKSSSAQLNTPSREPSSQNFTMPTLPMTTVSSVQTSRTHRQRNPPPTPSQLPTMLAPMAVYMSTLARLFEAVQVLDSIARQVEDPGLKYSSPTHVGLELSVRNAAEFFAFYIIRFVMSDLLLLVDKFLKRGSEWVMT